MECKGSIEASGKEVTLGNVTTITDPIPVQRAYPTPCGVQLGCNCRKRGGHSMISEQQGLLEDQY